jgi:2-iminobutanoate/2-iminopropanoate deaminase
MAASQRDGRNPGGLAVPKPAYSHVVVSGDLVYTSGQVGRDESGRFVSDQIEEQTRKTLENLRTCLAAAGCTLDDVVKVNTFLGKNEFFPVYDRVYREFFAEPFPARTTVAVSFEDETLIEIDAVARRRR